MPPEPADHHLLPDIVVANIDEYGGEMGRAWLREFPQLLARVVHDWALTLEAPYTRLSFNYVTRVRGRDGTEAVLKLGAPWDEKRTELEWLRHYQDVGAPVPPGEPNTHATAVGVARVLRADASIAALMLERLTPGDTLHAIDDDAATRLLANCMRMLRRPAPHGIAFPHVSEWLAALPRYRAAHGDAGPLDERRIVRAQDLLPRLLHAEKDVLLHGDLHHANVLRRLDAQGATRWTVIDAKGVVGPPTYECGPMLLNGAVEHQSAERVLELTRARIPLFAQLLGASERDIAQWGFVHTMLSACWIVESGGTRGMDAHQKLAAAMECCLDGD